MYLHLGKDVIIPLREVVAILDARFMRASEINQTFLRRVADAGRLHGEGLTHAKSVVVTTRRVYASPVSSKTLARRIRTRWWLQVLQAETRSG
jgi:hypothetical protein